MIFQRDTWTLFVLLIWYVVGQLLKYVLAFIGLDVVSTWIGWILFAVILTAITWGVAFYADSKIKEYIDDATNTSWETVLKPAYQYILQKLLHSVAHNSL